MSEPKIEGKLRIYRALYRMNISFANIVAQCHSLKQSRLLTRKDVHLYESFVQELQAEINEDVTDTLNSVEDRDFARFGKVRQAYEKALRDPNDVFIHAEERRRELARQGKKPPTLKRRKTLGATSRKAKRPRKESAT